MPALARALRRTGYFLLWAFLFALAYAQAPLYTSNQNQYFLQGLARAGVGYLSEDWLAGTLDPTPVFTWLVEWTQRLFAAPAVFYLYYALLMGVYLFSLVAIVSHLFDLCAPKTKRLLFFAILILIHSAALRYLLSSALGEDWKYLLEAGVAGQRLLGEVLQPSVFGVFLLLSIALFLSGRVYLATALLPLTATVHPTYLLSAAALTLAYMYLTYWETRRLKEPLRIALIALLLVLPILIYTYALFAPTDPEVYAYTRWRLVTFRLPHHALISEWFNAAVVVQMLIVAAALYLIRRTRLFWILAIPTALALVLTLIQWATGNTSLALLFPWRVSAFVVPLCTAILAGYALYRLWRRFEVRALKWRSWLAALSIVGIAALAVVGVVRFALQLDAKHSTPAWEMMEYVAAHKESGQVYLVPLDQQDFRLATGAPVMAEFKAIPYQDQEVAIWLSRVFVTSRFYRQGDSPENCALLDEFADQFGVTHIILEADQFSLSCPGLQELYQNEAYGVYEYVPSG